MWSLLRAVKQPAEGGGDPHILDMAPVYQTAVRRLREAAECPRMLVTGEFRIFPELASDLLRAMLPAIA